MYTGIGKTTLAYEICVKWARDGFLAEDFNVVVLIPLRSAQERSVEDVMVEYVGGKEFYKHLEESAGEKCLIILEGLDEITMDRLNRDNFLLRVLKNCTLFEKAKILVTSRPHACKNLDVGRIIEVVGFGQKEIEEFVEKSFKDIYTCHEFLQQLENYPHIQSLCYVPMHLVMIIDIFQVKEQKLPSTITELYQLFIVMTLQRQCKKENDENLSSSFVAATLTSVEERLCQLLHGMPKKAIKTMSILCKLTFQSFFKWFSSRKKTGSFLSKEKATKDPKIIFSINDLSQCGIEVTPEWDGYGLMKATHIHDLPTDYITYSFAHLSIQEFLCALYISALPGKKQQQSLRKHINDYPNVFIFFCGLIRLESPRISKLVCSMVESHNTDNVAVAARCVYESQKIDFLAKLQKLQLTTETLSPHECVCISYMLSRLQISNLNLNECYIGDKGVEMLVKYYVNANTCVCMLEEIKLCNAQITVTGLKHLMKILFASKLPQSECYNYNILILLQMTFH